MRTLVVGDIHGGLRALKQVLERCEFDNSKDKIIFLGDYSDGWSETAELIEFLIELNIKSESRHIFLRGNHDAWAEEWIKYENINPNWYNQGGKSTIDSYIRTNLQNDIKHLNFYNSLHNYYIDNENRGFVHGGFTSRKGLGHEPNQSIYYWDRDLWALAMITHGKIHEFNGIENYRRFEKHKELFIGHTTTMMYNNKPHYPEFNNPDQNKQGYITVPMNRCNVWNLDTGAGFSGKLTIMDIDTKEYWQSDYVKDLYPNENGR